MNELLKGDLKMPEIGHVGYLVQSAEQAAERFKTVCGTEDFYVYEYTPQRAFACGKEMFDCKLKIALCTPEKGAKIELIEVLSGRETPHFKAFEQSGEQIHHIAYYVDDMHEYDAWRAYYSGLGATFVFEADVEDDVMGRRCCFYATLPGMPHIIEFCKRGAVVKA